MGRGRDYTDAEREQALTAIVLSGDNCTRAQESLAAAGIDIPRQTINQWKLKYPERLEEIRILKAPALEERQARMAEQVADAAAHVTMDLIERTQKSADDLSAKDLPGAARNMATVYGIATEKGLLHRQKPTAITAHDYSSAVKGLERMGLIEGSAEEIPEASSLPEGQPA